MRDGCGVVFEPFRRARLGIAGELAKAPFDAITVGFFDDVTDGKSCFILILSPRFSGIRDRFSRPWSPIASVVGKPSPNFLVLYDESLVKRPGTDQIYSRVQGRLAETYPPVSRRGQTGQLRLWKLSLRLLLPLCRY